MIKTVWISIFLCLGLQVVAQKDPVLMHINGEEVSRSEYEYFCQMNGVREGGRKQKPMEAVNSFVNFKLKVMAAQAVGIDTTRIFREALEAYRRQLIKSYLTDAVGIERMARQRYEQLKTERRAGKILISQVFKKLPQNVSGYTLRTAQARMDSIYGILKKTDASVEFDSFVKKFSDEKKPFWTSWLQMPVEFEEIVSNLQPGDVSRPFFTPLGIHLVKVLERKEVLPFEELKEELIRSCTHYYDRDGVTEAMVEQLRKKYDFDFNKAGVNDLLTNGYTTQTLFTLAGKTYTGTEFARFAMTHPEGVQRQLNSFVMKSILYYEVSTLYLKPEFKMQMEAYRNNCLLEAITDRELPGWNKVDETSLKTYFEQHRSAYLWEEPRYKGIVLHCTTKRVAKQVRKFLKEIPSSEWMNGIRLAFNNGTKPQVQAQQGLFAIGDNPFVDAQVFKKKEAAAVLDFPVTVVLGKKMKGPESYQEVRNALLNDYQKDQEERWNAELRAVSKVEINQEVLKTVNNH